MMLRYTPEPRLPWRHLALMVALSALLPWR